MCVHVAEHEVVSRASLSPAIRGLSLSLLPGQLVVVCGRVGTGKSALLQALLGTMVPMDDASQGPCSWM